MSDRPPHLPRLSHVVGPADHETGEPLIPDPRADDACGGVKIGAVKRGEAWYPCVVWRVRVDGEMRDLDELRSPCGFADAKTASEYMAALVGLILGSMGSHNEAAN